VLFSDSTSIPGTPVNIYVSIDELRSAVNQLPTSPSSGTNDDQPPPIPPRVIGPENEVLSLVASNSSADMEEDENLQEHSPPPPPPPPPPRMPSGFEIYDGPSDEPIYASVQRILSHSLILGNERENPVVERAAEEITERETSVADDESPPLSSDDDDLCESDTAPLI